MKKSFSSMASIEKTFGRDSKEARQVIILQKYFCSIDFVIEIFNFVQFEFRSELFVELKLNSEFELKQLHQWTEFRSFYSPYALMNSTRVCVRVCVCMYMTVCVYVCVFVCVCPTFLYAEDNLEVATSDSPCYTPPLENHGGVRFQMKPSAVSSFS